MTYSNSKKQLHNYTSTPKSKTFSNQSIPNSTQSDEAIDAIKQALYELNDLKNELPQHSIERIPRITQLLQVFSFFLLLRLQFH